MAVSSDSPAVKESTMPVTTSETMRNEDIKPTTAIQTDTLPARDPTTETPATEVKASVDTAATFEAQSEANESLPSQEVLRKVENLMILDREGKSVPFKNLYSGPNVARRVLVLFIRHFFCGSCQEYIRTLSSSISPVELLSLPTPTFIAIVGCGSPSLIPMYATETSCPFPIYADPTKRVYNELGMLRTLNTGTRPGYQNRGSVQSVFSSVLQSFKMLKGGKAFQGGDYQQVGGEFLFEPTITSTPIQSPDGALEDEEDKQLGAGGSANLNIQAASRDAREEEKRITWCHRMTNTRDHSEIPQLRELLGLDSEEAPANQSRRAKRTSAVRKGAGASDFARPSNSPTMEVNGTPATEAR